jgi:hypothetical protein
MTESTNPPPADAKPCPSCQTPNPPETRICQFCGLVFSERQSRSTAEPDPLLEAAIIESGADASQGTGFARLIRPLIVLFVLVAVVTLILSFRGQTPTWTDDARNLQGVRTSSDVEFEELVLRSFNEKNLSSISKATGGVCLINLTTTEEPSGLLDKLGGKAVAQTMACLYAQMRQQAGAGKTARVVFYINGKRYIPGDCTIP